MFLITWLAIFLLQSGPLKAFRDGDARLVNSNRYGEGRVEVFYEGSWGTVCQRGWDLNDAEVICRQLGFPNGALRSIPGARFGQGTGRVLLSDVNCTGTENVLTECDNVVGSWALNDCEHASDVGVQCSAPNFEGCFRIGLLPGIEGFQVADMTLEKCFLLCEPGRYAYLWIHNGINCDCGNQIDSFGQMQNEDCSIECPGNSDQLCGGRDVASVYKVAVDLPFLASPGFPGRYTSTGGSLTGRRFVPRETTGYSYIRFHQFELPSTATMFISSNDRNGTIRGSVDVGEYWISSTNSFIQISFQSPQENAESLGFLLEVGEGIYCPSVTLSNGNISASMTRPYTVGTRFTVVCDPGYAAYDDTVFCQTDGTFNRNIQCVLSGNASVPLVPTPMLTPARVITTASLNPPLTVPGYACDVPNFDNGIVNATPGRQILMTGDVLVVMCYPAYEAVESTITCQSNGKFTSVPECHFNTVYLIIVIIIAAIVFILILLLIVILVCCSCYFGRKKRRRVSSYERRNEASTNEHGFRGPYGGPPRISANDYGDEIIALPDDILAPPVPRESSDSGTSGRGSPDILPMSDRNTNAGTNDLLSTGTNAEEDAIRSLDNVVDDMERETYGPVMRPTIAVSSGFGGHFSRT